ncbi:MAG: hypothetical protein M3186_07635 [Actinomycetota bacterium]|nr:hypothetical protein [Actinomycetota bacterium]
MSPAATDRLDGRAAITTHGTGARGFNLYDGSLQQVWFDCIATTGDGAIGIQVSKQLPVLEVRGHLKPPPVAAAPVWSAERSWRPSP